MARSHAVIPPPRRVLVIGLRRLGDLLLSTSVTRSLRAAFPEAQIDMLVAAGTEAMLAGNPDIDHVLRFERRAPIWPLIRRLWRRYDLAISLQPEDRGQFLALLAAPRRASIVPPAGMPGARWKRWLNQAWHPVDLHDTHAREQYMRLLDAIGVPRDPTVVPPRASNDARLIAELGEGWSARSFAVVHPSPQFRYKAWPEACWLALVQKLRERGLEVLLSGGADPAEVEAVQQIATAGGGRSLAGRLSFGELSLLLHHARIYVGPDTATSHLAAACGAPTVALFGPSNPVAWGPLPRTAITAGASPWQRRAPLQQCQNVWLMQGTVAFRQGCIPCMREGCEGHRGSRALCLDELAVSDVLAVVDAALLSAPDPALQASAGSAQSRSA